MDVCLEQPIEFCELYLREIRCKLNAYTRFDGSAMLAQGIQTMCSTTSFFNILIPLYNSVGDTAVAAMVNGPTEVKLHNLQVDKASVDVHFRSKSGLPSIADKQREKILRSTCESALMSVLYPRSSIGLQVFIMEDGGGVSFIILLDYYCFLPSNCFLQLLSCAVNACCLALLSSGISMKCMLAGIHCAITADGAIELDPEQNVCDRAAANLMFIFDSVDRNIVAAQATGRFTIGQYNDAITQCRLASQRIFEFYKDTIKKFANH